MSQATEASCRPPPAQVMRLTMKPARKDSGMYACVFHMPVPSRVSPDHPLTALGLHKQSQGKPYRTCWQPFHQRPGYPLLPLSATGSGKKQPTSEKATCSAYLIALLNSKEHVNSTPNLTEAPSGRLDPEFFTMDTWPALETWPADGLKRGGADKFGSTA